LAGSILHPNKIDVIAAAITQMEELGKGELVPNRIFMRPLDVLKIIADTKDTTNNYVSAQYIQVIANPTPGGLPSLFIMGVPVVKNLNVAAGYFYVCDMTKFNIRDKAGITVEMGHDQDDFTKNMVTIRAEKRLATYVKSNHAEAIIKDTFANALTYLETGS
jgi:HK97 family phage major capsid protein